MKKICVAVVLLLAVLAAAAFYIDYEQDRQYRMNHVFIGEDVYPLDVKKLDLRGSGISEAYHDELQALLPDCEILWDVPFQGGLVPSDAEEVTVSALSEADLPVLLERFPKLTAVDAMECSDYASLAALQQARPDWSVRYQVELEGIKYPLDTVSLDFADSAAPELMERLQYLPQVKTIHFSEPQMEAQAFLALMEAYPQVEFTWEKTVLGNTYNQEMTELDLSGKEFAPGEPEELEAGLLWFPALEKLVLCECNLDNETLAAWRERVRDQYKVVWSITVERHQVRTDATTFMPIRKDCHVRDMHLTELKYCEDMICVDIGHMGVTNIDWVNYMPHLQFLILADTRVEDITPVGTLKELIYLELFLTSEIHDYTPLLGCTALQDLNLAYTNGDVKVLAQMTWLDSLWANGCGATAEEKQLLRDSLPDTLLELDHGWHMGNGWRDRPNYYVMRDILQMPYYDWGSKRLAELNKNRGG